MNLHHRDHRLKSSSDSSHSSVSPHPPHPPHMSRSGASSRPTRPFGLRRSSRSPRRAHGTDVRLSARIVELAKVIPFSKYTPPRLVQRLRQAGLRVKIGVFLLCAFLVLVGVPSVSAITMNRGVHMEVLNFVHTRDAQTSIRVLRWKHNDVVQMPLNDYLVNVLSAEMSPTAPFPALEAAAIAARTYAIRAMQPQLFVTPTFAQTHAADVTDNPELDLPWLTSAEQQQVFKVQAGVDTLRLQQAVAATDGLVLTYKGEPIMAFTFPLSPGETRNGSQVLQANLPYLPSVACPDDRNASGVHQTFHFTSAQLAQDLKIALPTGPAGQTGPNTQAGQTVDARLFKLGPRDAEGFISSVTYQSQAWTGPQFAALLHLPSSDLTLQAARQSTASGQVGMMGSMGVIVQTSGIGLNLGMSLHEAVAMASRGESWKQILAYFYPSSKVELDSGWIS